MKKWLAYTLLFVLTATFVWAQSFPTPNSGTTGGSSAVTNAGTFVVQEDGAALTSLQIIDNVVFGAGTEAAALRVTLPTDGTGIVVLADNTGEALKIIGGATDKALAVDLFSTDGTQIPNGNGSVSAGVIRVTIADDSTGVIGLNAGTRHANSPTTEVASLDLFNGAGETQIAATNFGASKAITITGSGRIVKVCVTTSLNTPHAEAMTIYFFDADPVITIEDADWPSVAVAETVIATVSLAEADFDTSKASALVNCQDTNESFHAITHVVFSHDGSTTYDDNDIVLHVLYRRDA